MTDWISTLRTAISSDPRGITGVAERLGYSRPAISRVLSGSYRSPEKIAARVLSIYALIDCPYLRASLAHHECHGYATRKYSAITAAEVPHWRACKRCQHNPANVENAA